MRVKPKTARQAFTLLEVIIAISVFSLIMIGVIACWKCVIQGTETGRKAAANAQYARVAINSVETALATAEMCENTNFYYCDFDNNGDFTYFTLVSHLPPSFPFSGYFSDFAAVRRVTLQVRPEPDGEKSLVLTQTPVLEGGDEERDPYPIVLAREVTFFRLDFWSTKEQDYLPNWDAVGQLPPRVRVMLGVGHMANDRSAPFEVVTRVVDIPATAHPIQ